jgi:Asp-tRNA(Asn)/Glu-tRNA(Gln) amidotransferase A subunit family amidase
MPELDLAFWSVDQLTTAYRSGELSPVEVTTHFLERIEAYDAELNSYLTITRDLALKQAASAEAAYRAGGSDLPSLLGVPISIKDLFDVAGEPTSLGSRAFLGTTAAGDSLVVSGLRSAGAVFLGKSNTAEFGQSATTDNRLGPECRNPWDQTRTSGGSSGGAAAGVAAGLAAVSLGSDGGGSIRIPAAMCGLFGIKPTYAELPASDSFHAMTRFVCAGPISRTVADARAVLGVQLGRAVPASAERGRMRVAWCPTPEDRPVDAGVRSVTRAAVEALAAAGHTVEEVTLPVAGWIEAFSPLVLADEWKFRQGLLADSGDDLTRYVRKGIEAGRGVTPEDVERALVLQGEVRARVAELLTRFDVIATPTTAVTAFEMGRRPTKVDGHQVEPLWGAFPFTAPFNVTGSPAASIPIGLSDGLPVGLQVVGAAQGEEVVLDRCAELEALMAFPADQMVRRWSAARPVETV